MTTLKLQSTLIVLTIALLLSGTAIAAPGKSDELTVYFGTYTDKGGKGIYLGHLDIASGKLRVAGVAAELENPSFLAIHPTKPLLYAVGEMGNFQGRKGGALSALAINSKTGLLTLLNQKSSQGADPCHLAVDRQGKSLIVVNYSGGSVASLPIQSDGRLGDATSFFQHKGASVNRERQQGPHAHGVTLDAAGRFAFVPDLGLDKIMIYRIDAATGKLTANHPAWASATAGAGPRHIAFHPDGRFAYVINELNSTMTVFAYDPAAGTLQPLQTASTLPEGFHGANTAAEVVVHPSGKFVYGSNRGQDSIAVFAIDAATGKINCIGHQSTQGKSPRNFAIDPSGAYLLAANQDSNNVVVFRIDPQSGKLHATGESVSLPSPVCILMVHTP